MSLLDDLRAMLVNAKVGSPEAATLRNTIAEIEAAQADIVAMTIDRDYWYKRYAEIARALPTKGGIQ